MYIFPSEAVLTGQPTPKTWQHPSESPAVSLARFNRQILHARAQWLEYIIAIDALTFMYPDFRKTLQTGPIMSQNYMLDGYHKLALLMGRSNNLGIFRKFDDLNMLSLMSLQAEIVELRDEFYSICEEDENNGKSFARSFEKLFESKEEMNSFQYSKLLEVRQKMKEYSENVSASID